MRDLDKRLTEREARRVTAYGEAVNRYLGVAGHAPGAAVARRTGGLVVVGVDDTPASHTAADHAAIEAGLRRWDLRLVHVQHPGGGPQARDRGSDLLQRLTDRVHAYSPGVAVTSSLAVGTPAALLLAAARTADLVVVGCRHGTAGSVFGLTVGERVAAQHDGPVLVVRIPNWPPGPAFATRPMVVGIDEPELAKVTAEFALTEAKARGCPVIMLHAGDAKAGPDQAETIGGVLVHHRTIAADPVPALVAASSGAAAVVVGRRRHGGPTGALLGSVSRSLVQQAHCPVFLVS